MALNRSWLISAGIMVALITSLPAQKEAASREKSSKTESRKGADREVSRTSGMDDAFVDPRNFNDRVLSKMIFDLTNLERKKAGLPELSENSYLGNSATAHSRDMASRGYFNHKSKGLFNRTNPRDRVEAVGYNPSMVAENIAMIPTFNSTRTRIINGRQVVETDYNSYRRLAEYAMQEWMKSPGHKKNILNGKLSSLGVGTAIGFQSNVPYVYLTQNFGG